MGVLNSLLRNECILHIEKFEVMINNSPSFKKIIEELRFHCSILDPVRKCIGKQYRKYQNKEWAKMT